MKDNLFTYAVCVRGAWIGMVCMPTNQMVKRSVEEILSEKMAVCR